jgi:hypothetical protein
MRPLPKTAVGRCARQIAFPGGVGLARTAGRSRRLRGLGELLTTGEAALFLSIPVNTLTWYRRRAIRRGPPYLKLHAHAVRYRLADLDRWLETKAINPERDSQRRRGNETKY